MSRHTLGDYGAGGQRTLDGAPEQSEETESENDDREISVHAPDLDKLDPERVLGTRAGWLVLDVKVAGSNPHVERELRSAGGDRLTIWDSAVNLNGSLLKEVDEDDDVETVAFEYARSNPSVCQHGNERCPGRQGLRKGVLPCWDCWTAAPRNVINQFHVAEDLRPSDGRDP